MLTLFILCFIGTTEAKVNVSIVHNETREGFAQIKVVNETNAAIACYVAIDGKKIKLPNNKMHYPSANALENHNKLVFRK